MEKKLYDSKERKKTIMLIKKLEWIGLTSGAWTLETLWVFIELSTKWFIFEAKSRKWMDFSTQIKHLGADQHNPFWTYPWIPGTRSSEQKSKACIFTSGPARERKTRKWVIRVLKEEELKSGEMRSTFSSLTLFFLSPLVERMRKKPQALASQKLCDFFFLSWGFGKN